MLHSATCVQALEAVGSKHLVLLFFLSLQAENKLLFGGDFDSRYDGSAIEL